MSIDRSGITQARPFKRSEDIHETRKDDVLAQQRPEQIQGGQRTGGNGKRVGQSEGMHEAEERRGEVVEVDRAEQGAEGQHPGNEAEFTLGILRRSQVSSSQSFRRERNQMRNYESAMFTAWHLKFDRLNQFARNAFQYMSGL